MPASKDPTVALKKAAAAMPDVIDGMSCNQTSFKVGKKAFLYVGPGAKGIGYKAMFKLTASIAEAEELAEEDPDCWDVGSNGWVTARFSCEKPLPKKIWGRWLKESYAEATASGGKKRR